MTDQSVEFERKYSVEEAAGFLRKLADTIEQGGSDSLPDFDIGIDEFKKLKVTLTRHNDSIKFKARIKYYTPETIVGDIPTKQQSSENMKFTTLKKMMGKNFKAMGEILGKNELPSRFMVQTFLGESQLMISYPGYGDEFYQAYIAACHDFEKSFLSGDIAAVQKHYSSLIAMKNACHSRNK